MRFDAGTIVVIVAVLIFYLRLMVLQWGKSKRLRDLATIQPKAKANKAKAGGGAGSARRPTTADVMRFRFRNVYLTAFAILLMVAGVVMNFNVAFLLSVRQFWWIPMTLGLILFGYEIR
jgi:hypothetical protein